MKNVKLLLSVLVAVGLLATVATLMTGCDDDDEPPALTLTTLTAGAIDLNGAASATGVPVDATITAVFSTEVSETTVDAITLTREFDGADYPATITIAGNTVTIDPDDNFSTGTLFILEFGAGLGSTGGKLLTEPIERNFTSQGTFAVPDAIAHWTFEDNANDIIGNFDPTAAQVIAVTYEAGRKADAGKAAAFNGTTSIIEISNGDQLMNNGDWALSLWVKPNSSLAKGQFVLGLGAFHGFQVEINGAYENLKLAASYAHNKPAAEGKFNEDLWVDATGNLGWQGWTFSKDYAGGFDDVIKDKWTHIVFVYNSTNRTGTAYVNGEKAKEQDFDLWPDDSNPRFTTGLSYKGVAPDVVNELAFGFIQSRAGTMWDAEPWGGYDLPGANHFHGLLDDVIIYHKVITEAEITSMFNSGKP